MNTDLVQELDFIWKKKIKFYKIVVFFVFTL